MEGTVTVTVEVNADGSPVNVETTYEISDKSRSACYGKVFLASATEAVKRWKFRPELVAGHVVPGSTVRIPIDYCLGSPGNCGGKRPAAAAERKLPAGLSQGAASAVGLKTDVRGPTICTGFRRWDQAQAAPGAGRRP